MPPSDAAFNHILTDVSLVVYQFETIAGFSGEPVCIVLGAFSLEMQLPRPLATPALPSSMQNCVARSAPVQLWWTDWASSKKC